MKTKLDQLTLWLKGGRKVQGYFDCCRIKREQVPEGYHKYDLRHSDDDDGEITEIQDTVVVNHFGTFVTKEVIDNAKDGLPVEEWDFDPWCDQWLEIER